MPTALAKITSTGIMMKPAMTRGSAGGTRATGPGLERIDLFGHPHRTQLGGIAGTNAAGENHRGQHRAQLEHDGLDQHARQEVDRNGSGELVSRLQRGNPAREPGDQQHDEKLPTPMFHASVIARGTQIFTSLRPRTSSTTSKLSLPIWETEVSEALPINRGTASTGEDINPRGECSCRGVSFEPHTPKSTPGSIRGSSPEVILFRRRWNSWFRRHGRDLPWRRTRDPYHIVVSEFMLQQTQVARVEWYYGRFLRHISLIPTGPWPRPRWYGNHGKGWDTIGERPTCIGWPLRWSTSETE